MACFKVQNNIAKEVFLIHGWTNNGFDFTEKSVKFNQDDIDKAIDDMKKEVVLEQYTYFVEPANLGTDADGTVRLKG